MRYPVLLATASGPSRKPAKTSENQRTSAAQDSSIRHPRRIVNEHLAGTRDHTLRLWQLVVFEKWHQHYVDRQIPLCAPAIPLQAARVFGPR